MTIGASLLLIAVGAILRFAVSDAIPGVELGVVGLVIGLFISFNGRRDAVAEVPVDRRPVDPRF